MVNLRVEKYEKTGFGILYLRLLQIKSACVFSITNSGNTGESFNHPKI